ncbi:hypothetical protein HBB16_11660 [Pseudonocardia sp. MCCB 268]|nr:hypothetical protein [Pseudonocardia cytotoxica]
MTATIRRIFTTAAPVTRTMSSRLARDHRPGRISSPGPSQFGIPTGSSWPATGSKSASELTELSSVFDQYLAEYSCGIVPADLSTCPARSAPARSGSSRSPRASRARLSATTASRRSMSALRPA